MRVFHMESNITIFIVWKDKSGWRMETSLDQIGPETYTPEYLEIRGIIEREKQTRFQFEKLNSKCLWNNKQMCPIINYAYSHLEPRREPTSADPAPSTMSC